MAYYKFSVATAALCNSGHVVEAAQRYLEAKKRWPVGSDATACMGLHHAVTGGVRRGHEVAKPESGGTTRRLKVLSARVVRAAPDDIEANQMRAGSCAARAV